MVTGLLEASMSDLFEAFQEVDGVGEKTAEKLVAIVEERGSDNGDVAEAYEYLKHGQTAMAESMLERVV